MDFILLIRWVIFLTFILLTVEGVVAIIMSRHFFKLYVRKHGELENRIQALEQREKQQE